LERGRVFHDLPTPVTIGREDDNSIRLNDERVSRFHAKIQENGGSLILTDLESTNGTRVNGHPVQMRVVQIGDQVSIGRCLLIIGSREQIMTRAAQFREEALSGSTDEILGGADAVAEHVSRSDDSDRSFTAHGIPMFEQARELFPDGPPPPPRGLGPLQRAEFSDFVAFLHEQIRIVLLAGVEETSTEGRGAQSIRVDWEAWQRLLQAEMDLAIYLRKIADPDDQ
jgi:predicted component of type VI protein secretion system